MKAGKLVRRNFLVYWRAWRMSFFLSVLTPLMFLSAMGWGLGSLIESDRSFGGEYLAFFATGMLAASAMQTGVFQATYPMLSKIQWQRNYEAVLASPLQVRDIFIGEIAWIGITLAMLSIPFFGVMAAFGIFDTPTAALAIPIVILVGLSCASVVAAYTATMTTDESYVLLFRIVVTPLFLLSGTFFPVSQLPLWGRVIAEATPLYHGVALVRQVTISNVSPIALWHLAYLVALLAVGTYFGIRNLERRLQP